MKPEVFLNYIIPGAQAVHRKTGIPASITTAQAILESGWGASKLTKLAFNIFGIKADKSWKGRIVYMDTREVFLGKSVMVPAPWRAYDTFEEAIADRTAFLKANKRYSSCWKETTAEGWAHALQKAGYATDPLYAELLMEIIRGRNLTRFDRLEKNDAPAN